MNFRINYWTFLFGIALLGVGFSQWQLSNLQRHVNPAFSTSICPEDIVIRPVPRAGIDSFDSAGLIFPDTTRHGTTVGNPDITHWLIPHCEMMKMESKKEPFTTTEAWLALKPAGNDTAEIHLYFQIIKKKLHDHDPDTLLYYDFTTPCPPCSVGEH